MAEAHITLDGRLYMLTDLGLYHKGTANQMAHAVGQGQTQYRDLTSWSAWVQADWQAGTGMKDPEGGGFLYADGADTRFPQQLILGPWVEYSGTVARAEQQAAQFVGQAAIGAPAGLDRIYVPIASGDYSAGWQVWIAVEILDINTDTVTLTFRMRQDSSGDPGSTLQSTSVTLDMTQWRPGVQWVASGVGAAIASPSAPYWLEIENLGETVVNVQMVQDDAQTTLVDAAGSTYADFQFDDTRPKQFSSIVISASDPNDVTGAIITDGAGNWALMQDDEIFRSTDEGKTWSSAHNHGGSTGNFSGTGAVGSNGTWIMARRVTLRVYRSTDSGATWTEINPGLSPALRPRHIASDGAGVWILVGDYSASPGTAVIWRSTDDGLTWSEVKTHQTGGNNSHQMDRVATDGSGRWFAVSTEWEGDYGAGTLATVCRLWKSTDNGATWTEVLDATTAAMAWLGSPIQIWIDTDGSNNWFVGGFARQFYYSSDNGDTWTLATGHSETVLRAAGRNTATGTWYGVRGTGTMTLTESTDNGVTWSTIGTIGSTRVVDRGAPVFATNGSSVWILGGIYNAGASGFDALIWRTGEEYMPWLNVSPDWIATPDSATLALVSFNDTVYLLNHGSAYKWDNSAGTWGAAIALGSNPAASAAVLADDEMWIAFGGSGSDIRVMDDTESFTTKTSTKADLLFIGAGYLWRSVGHTLYYTDDGSTWQGPIALYPHRYPIRGMAALEGELYCSTDFALYHIAPGDVADFITKWGIVDPANGAGMIEYNGALYIPVGQDLIEFGPTGGVRPMGLNQREGLPDDRQGRVTALAALNNYLLAGVSATATGGSSSLWAWTGEGWHNLAVFPEGLGVKDLKFEDETANLWVALGDGDWAVQAKIRLPNDLTNPAKDARDDIRFMPAGWLETDWFYAGVRQNSKDWESVTVFGENLGADRYVEVYYQADTDTTWTYLGRATADGTELIWSDLDTRPTGKRMRLGVLLETQAPLESPILNAVSLKYMTMLHDWFRWTLPIGISGGPATKQQLLDGSVQAYTGDEQMAHLLGLATRVKPINMVDLDGTAQVVKVIDVQMQPAKYAVKGATREIEWRAMVTVENVRSA